jgi:HlyD family secretion protein
VDLGADELPPGWAIGQRAEVFIQTGKKDNVVQVPRKLVRWREGSAGVFVIADGKAAWRNLRLGLAGGEIAEVESGLAAGDKVITGPETVLPTLQPGRRVVTRP